MSFTVKILDQIARRIVSTVGGGMSEHMYSIHFIIKTQIIQNYSKMGREKNDKEIKMRSAELCG